MQTDAMTAWCLDKCRHPDAVDVVCERPEGHTRDHQGTGADGVEFAWWYGQ